MAISCDCLLPYRGYPNIPNNGGVSYEYQRKMVNIFVYILIGVTLFLAVCFEWPYLWPFHIAYLSIMRISIFIILAALILGGKERW
jgi:hypothetical protein